MGTDPLDRVVRSVGMLTSTDHGSTAIRHQCDESREMMIRVVGTRTGFWVVLNAEDRLVTMGHRRNRAVVEIQMGDLHLVQGKA